MTDALTQSIFYTSGSQSMVPKTSASAQPGNMLEMQVSRLCPRPTEAGMLGLGPSNLNLLSSSGNSEGFEPLITHPFSKYERTRSVKKYSGTCVSSEKELIPIFLTVKSLQKESS